MAKSTTVVTRLFYLTPGTDDYLIIHVTFDIRGLKYVFQKYIDDIGKT